MPTLCYANVRHHQQSTVQRPDRQVEGRNPRRPADRVIALRVGCHSRAALGRCPVASPFLFYGSSVFAVGNRRGRLMRLLNQRLLDFRGYCHRDRHSNRRLRPACLRGGVRRSHRRRRGSRDGVLRGNWRSIHLETILSWVLYIVSGFRIHAIASYILGLPSSDWIDLTFPFVIVFQKLRIRNFVRLNLTGKYDS